MIQLYYDHDDCMSHQWQPRNLLSKFLQFNVPISYLRNRNASSSHDVQFKMHTMQKDKVVHALVRLILVVVVVAAVSGAVAKLLKMRAAAQRRNGGS